MGMEEMQLEEDTLVLYLEQILLMLLSLVRNYLLTFLERLDL